MAAWKRCGKCNYVRHVNDDSRSPSGTCPWCGAIYEKAEPGSNLQRRRRTDVVQAYLFNKGCSACGETFSFFAKQCPRCKTSNRGLRLSFALATATGIMLSVTLVSGMFTSDPVVSPFPGVSNQHFATCIQLSKNWSNLNEELGNSAAATLQAQNDWHASCSRKALREVASRTTTRLPSTPEDWIVAMVD